MKTLLKDEFWHWDGHYTFDLYRFNHNNFELIGVSVTVVTSRFSGYSNDADNNNLLCFRFYNSEGDTTFYDARVAINDELYDWKVR